jgi:hypothetical protein
MADLNRMATNIQTILSKVPGIEQAYDHEPQTMSVLPSATLYFDGFTLVEETGGKDSLNLAMDYKDLCPFKYIGRTGSTIEAEKFNYGFYQRA